MDQIIGALYELAGHDAKTAKGKVSEIFQKYDIDHNGSLDKHEFVNFIVSDPVCSQVFHL